MIKMVIPNLLLRQSAESRSYLKLKGVIAVFQILVFLSLRSVFLLSTVVFAQDDQDLKMMNYHVVGTKLSFSGMKDNFVEFLRKETNPCKMQGVDTYEIYIEEGGDVGDAAMCFLVYGPDGDQWVMKAITVDKGGFTSSFGYRFSFDWKSFNVVSWEGDGMNREVMAHIYNTFLVK